MTTTALAAWKKRKSYEEAYYTSSLPEYYYARRLPGETTHDPIDRWGTREHRFLTSEDLLTDGRYDELQAPNRMIPYYLKEPPRRRLRMEDHWIGDIRSTDHQHNRSDFDRRYENDGALPCWLEPKEQRPKKLDVFDFSMDDRVRRSELSSLEDQRLRLFLSRESLRTHSKTPVLQNDLRHLENPHGFAAAAKKLVLPRPFISSKKKSTAEKVNNDKEKRVRPEDRWTIVPPASTELVPNSGKGQVVPMSKRQDRSVLTPYQVLIRESMEYFTATEEDIETKVQGRRKTILRNQVGIRCRYCSHLPINLRMRAAVYYPRTLPTLYQGAQNIACVHFQQCTELPKDVLEKLLEERPRKVFSKCGRPYWIEACKEVGIYEDDNGLWMLPPRKEEFDLPHQIL